MTNLNKVIIEKRANADFSGFVKFDDEKIRYELLDPYPLQEIAKVLTYGAKKYNDHNWSKCNSVTRYFGACCRHLFAWLGGEDNDSETGISHLAHAGCCIFFMMGLLQRKGSKVDDRHSKLLKARCL